jgi:trimethylamine:corrinoid methyltransferase-like protein
VKQDEGVWYANGFVEMIIVRFASSVNRLSKLVSRDTTLLYRQPWDVWEAAGSKTAIDRIRAKLKKILARHAPPPLPDGAAEKIAAILQEAEARNTK